MPSPLVWRVVTIHFRLNSYLYKWPISWHPSTKQFEVTRITRRNWRTYFLWMFVIYFLYFVLSMGSAFYVIVRRVISPKDNVSLVHVILYGMILGAGGLATGIAAFVMYLGDHAVTAVNYFIKCYEELDHYQHNNGDSEEEEAGQPDQEDVEDQLATIVKKRLWRTPEGKLDVLGVLATFILIPLPFIPIVCVPFGHLANLTVYQYFFEDVIPPALYNVFWFKIPFNLFSFISAYLVFAESCRVFPILLFFMLLPAELMLRSISLLQNTTTQNTDGSSSVEKYSRLYKIYTEISLYQMQDAEVLKTGTFFLLVCGAFLSACCNFATLRLYDSGLSFGFWCLFPFCSLAVIVAIQQILPTAVNVNEHSAKAILKWKSTMNRNRGEGKYLYKKFRAVRPMRFYAGFGAYSFFPLKKSVMTSYPMNIVEYTISLLFCWNAKDLRYKQNDLDLELEF